MDDEDDEDVPQFGRQILPVANLPSTFDGEPTDGLQYLFTVRYVSIIEPTDTFTHEIVADVSSIDFRMLRVSPTHMNCHPLPRLHRPLKIPGRDLQDCPPSSGDQHLSRASAIFATYVMFSSN
jgi:hypothetical protein